MGSAILGVASIFSSFLPSFGQFGSALLGGGIQYFLNQPTPDQPAPTQPQNYAKSTFETAEGNEIRAIGVVRLGGLKSLGNTNEFNRYRNILHCKGEIDAYLEFYFGGREIIVDADADGAVSSHPWAIPGGSYAFVKSVKGTGSEVAWPDLLTDFPDLWTADHRARGIAQSLVRYVSPGFNSPKFLKLYQEGPPDLEVVIRGEKGVYDPRTGLSAWSDNGILGAQHVLLTSYSDLSVADIDAEFNSAQADLAEDLINTKAGTVARSRSWGVWTSETPRGENLQRVLDSIGAWIVTRGTDASIGIELIPDAPTGEVTIAAEHIIRFELGGGPQGVERPNICRIKYYSPERNFDMTQIDMTGIAWAYIDSEVGAYGEQHLDVDLPFCPNASQAQRRARQMFYLARADSGIVVTNMTGLGVWGERLAYIEFPDDLGTKLCMIGSPRGRDRQGEVEIPFWVWPTLSEWDPDVDEADAPEPIPNLAFSSPLTVPSVPTGSSVVTYGGSDGSATRVSYTIPIDAPSSEATYRTYSGGLPSAWSSMTEYVAASGFVHAYVPLNLSGVDLDFRVRTYSGDDQVSDWSDVLHVTGAISNVGPLQQGISLECLGSGDIRTRVIVPDALNVAYLSLSGPGSTPNTKIRPGENIQWDVSNPAAPFTCTAAARSTNGTTAGTMSASGDDGAEQATGVRFELKQLTSTSVRITWHKPNTPAVNNLNFTGPGSPGTSGSPGVTDGFWDVTGLTAGTYTWTARGFDPFTPTTVGPLLTLSITVP